jgi:hypothetical protein
MRVQLTELYVLVETDDIDFSMLRLAIEESLIKDSEQTITENIIKE